MPKFAAKEGTEAVSHSAAVTNPMAALKQSSAPLPSSGMIVKGSLGMPGGRDAQNNPLSPKTHPTASAKHDTVRGKPSRSKSILPSEQNCLHSCAPALPSLSVFCLINYRTCTIFSFFFRAKKNGKKKEREEENQSRMPCLQTPPASAGPHGSAAARIRRFRPRRTPALPGSPAHRCGLPPGPRAALGKAKPATVLSQLCQEHHHPAGASPASRTGPEAMGSASCPAPAFLGRKESRSINSSWI